MFIVRSDRWRHVDTAPPTMSGKPFQRCSLCTSRDLIAKSEVALDPYTGTRYSVFRCHGCGYDLLEPLTVASAAAN